VIFQTEIFYDLFCQLVACLGESPGSGLGMGLDSLGKDSDYPDKNSAEMRPPFHFRDLGRFRAILIPKGGPLIVLIGLHVLETGFCAAGVFRVSSRKFSRFSVI